LLNQAFFFNKNWRIPELLSLQCIDFTKENLDFFPKKMLEFFVLRGKGGDLEFLQKIFPHFPGEKCGI